MIRKSEIEDIAKILKLEDTQLTKVFPCEVGEWVQFLVQHIDNPNFFMISSLDGDDFIGYFIALSVIVPPISKSVTILYSKLDKENDLDSSLRELESWTKEKGIASIDCITNDIVSLAKYGFKEKAKLMMLKL